MRKRNETAKAYALLSTRLAHAKCFSGESPVSVKLSLEEAEQVLAALENCGKQKGSRTPNNLWAELSRKAWDLGRTGWKKWAKDALDCIDLHVERIKHLESAQLDRRHFLRAIDEQAKEIKGNYASSIFVGHIRRHLKPHEFVVCKICGKTINEIFHEELVPLLRKVRVENEDE